MQYLKRLAIIFFLLNTCQYIHAQDTIAKTLLWRISGKGLQKPSFLYGTIHLSDKKLFYFGDSVYSSLESADGFAMELDPDIMMDSLFSKLSDADTTSLLIKLINKEKFDNVSKKLEKKFGMPAEKITRKQLIEEREGWYYKRHKKDDMKSVVDIYLYNIAHQLGKWVGGIEDVNDQLGIKDELGKDIDIMDYVNDVPEKTKDDYLGKMMNTYIDGDIGEIEKMYYSKSKHYKDLLLITRNIKMARRMDSLAHIRNSFFAVGAAHLPGDSGVIQLLRGRGFTVEPVFSSKKIAPEKYVYKTQEFPWLKVVGTDSAYTAEMPGKPSDLKIMGDELKMKVYGDLVNNVFYMTGFVYNSNTGNDNSLQRLIKAYTTGKFKKIDENKIDQSGYSGTEIISISEAVYYRIHLFSVADKIFLVIVGAQTKDNLFTKNIDRFFSGFIVNNNIQPKPVAEWVEVSNEQKAFKMSFPKKPAIDKLKQMQVGENMETTTYTSLDMASGTYYMLVISETKKGFLITADSIIFNNKLETYRQNDAVISDINYFDFQGTPAISFTAANSKDGVDLVSKLLIISRGNRSYSMAVITEKGKEDYPDITRFFRSFNLLDYKAANWAKRYSANDLFSTWAPSKIEVDIPETDTTQPMEDFVTNTANRKDEPLQYMAYDTNTVITYYISVYPTGRYYWAKDNSELLSDQLEQYYSDTASYFAKSNPGKFDSLIYKKETVNGITKGYEILVNSPKNNSLKKIRVFYRGDSVYHLFVIADRLQINDENNNKFFNDFKFEKEQISTTLFSNKTTLILQDLLHKDSASRAEANDAIGASKFTVTDLPSLFDAYLKQYPVDSNQYWTTNQRIGSAISKINDPAVLNFVKKNYSNIPSGLSDLKMNMLEMLAEQKSVAAAALIKELLLADPPVNGTPYSLFYRLSDTLQLYKQFFPEISRLYKDSLFGSTIVGLASRLIDSNLISKEILNSSIDDISGIAKKQLEELKKDNDAYPFNNSYIIGVLGKINTRGTNELLYEYLKLPLLYIKQNAVLALVMNDQAVPGSEFQKIAAEPGMRIDFYKSLKEKGKIGLFPKEYATQQKFAESYLYDYTEEDDSENKIILKQVAEKTIEENGIGKRYYLFKLTTSYDGEKQSSLAICGPFDINKEIIEIQTGAAEINVVYDEKYSAGSIDRLFDKFIEENRKDKEK